MSSRDDLEKMVRNNDIFGVFQVLCDCDALDELENSQSSSSFSHTFPLRPISRDRCARVNGYDLLGHDMPYL